MKGTTFAQFIRYKTKTNSTTLPDADIALLANVNKDMLAQRITDEVDEAYFEIEETRDLKVDQREYSFPQDMLLNMTEMAAMLDGTNWSYPTEVPNGQFDQWADNAGIKDEYTGKMPEFVIGGRGFKLLSGDDIIEVTDGLKIVANVYPEDISATDLAGTYDLSIPQDPNKETKHALPRAVHKVWALLCVIDYKQGKDKPIPLTEQERNIETLVARSLKQLKLRNKDRSTTGSMPSDDGSNY